MATLTATTLGTIREFEHSLDSGVDKKHNARQVINVKDFGATGNGSTDDHGAIQDALDAAFGGPFPAHPSTSGGNRSDTELNKEIYFPPGKYVVTLPLVVCGTEGGRIHGSGRDTTELLFRAVGTEGNDICGDAPGITPLWMVDGFLHCTVSDMTWTNDLAEPFVTKTTSSSTAAAGTVLNFADTSDVVVGSVVSNFSSPANPAAATVLSKTSTTVTVDAAIAGGVDAGATIYFISQCIGFFAYQSSNRGATSTITFRNLVINDFSNGILAGFSVAQCDNGILENVVFNNCSLCAVKTLNGNTVNWGVFGGGAHNCALATTHKPYSGSGLPQNGNFGAAYCIAAGSIPTIVGIHTSGNGWAMYSSSSQGQMIIGARMEDRHCIAVAGASVFLSGCEFTGGDATEGARIFSLVSSGYITAQNCTFAPTSTIAATPNYLAQLDNAASWAVFRECTFAGHADELGFKGAANGVHVRVSMINCDGPSMPSTATLFADYTGHIDDYQPNLHGIAVASLPAAASKWKGVRGWVTDANATTFMSTVAQGGSNVVKVFCDGTNWKIA